MTIGDQSWRELRPADMRLDVGEVVVWAVGPFSGRPRDLRPPSSVPEVRRVIAAYTGTDELAHGDRGEPRCVASSLSISLSSTNDLAVLALGQGVDVGVDVEWSRPIEIGGLSTYLSEEERSVLVSGPGAGTPSARMLRLWVRKEAWSKLERRGIDARWKEQTVTPTWPPACMPVPAAAEPDTSVVTLPGPAGYEAALAWRGCLRRLHLVRAPAGSGSSGTVPAPGDPGPDGRGMT